MKDLLDFIPITCFLTLFILAIVFFGLYGVVVYGIGFIIWAAFLHIYGKFREMKKYVEATHDLQLKTMQQIEELKKSIK
jgi:hypothetical protein